MTGFLKSMHELASPDNKPCVTSRADADNLSKELSVTGLSRNMQGVGSSSTEAHIVGKTDAKCMQDVVFWDKQGDKMDESQDLRKMRTVEKKHTFWETQPVEQYRDREKNIEEGPIAPVRSVAEVRTEPYMLPKHYEWCTCDVNCDNTMVEIYNLLSSHYVEDVESMFRCSYSKDFLQWALRPPGYFPCWHIGVRVETTKRLVALITGIPVNIRVRDTHMLMAEINFLCIHKKLRSKRLAPLLIREVTRRVHLENVWQAEYTAGVVLPTPIATCQYWHRPLNPKKLIKVGFSQLGPGMTMGQTIKHYRIPYKTLTAGFRAMERGDLSEVVRLLQQYLLQFVVAPELSDVDAAHWLVPIENVVHTYVVEDPETHKITDFSSFYTLPSSVLGGDQNHTTLKNQSFLKELKFRLGDGHLQYYLYNYRLKEALAPRELGLILL